MEKPVVIECFADNGAHSHWALIEEKEGKLLWDENDEKVLDDKLNLLKEKIAGLIRWYDVPIEHGARTVNRTQLLSELRGLIVD